MHTMKDKVDTKDLTKKNKNILLDFSWLLGTYILPYSDRVRPQMILYKILSKNIYLDTLPSGMLVHTIIFILKVKHCRKMVLIPYFGNKGPD